MLTPKNLKTITFGTSVANSAGEPVRGTEREYTLLFNVTQISVEQVERLIDEDRWEFDARVVEITPQQLKYLADKS